MQEEIQILIWIFYSWIVILKFLFVICLDTKRNRWIKNRRLILNFLQLLKFLYLWEKKREGTFHLHFSPLIEEPVSNGEHDAEKAPMK